MNAASPDITYNCKICKFGELQANMYNNVVNIDNEIMGGTPVFSGTRVPIKNLFDYLETGDSIEVFLEDFESVSRGQVIKVLEMSKKFVETFTGMLDENIA